MTSTPFSVGWQSIDTAPTGVEALFFIDSDDEPGWIIMAELSAAEPQRFERYDCRYFPHENGGYATHWMPLPAAPEPTPTERVEG